MLAISFVRAGRWANEVRVRRKDLSPEMQAFVKGDKALGENGPLNRVANAIWSAVYNVEAARISTWTCGVKCVEVLVRKPDRLDGTSRSSVRFRNDRCLLLVGIGISKG